MYSLSNKQQKPKNKKRNPKKPKEKPKTKVYDNDDDDVWYKINEKKAKKTRKIQKNLQILNQSHPDTHRNHSTKTHQDSMKFQSSRPTRRR